MTKLTFIETFMQEWIKKSMYIILTVLIYYTHFENMAFNLFSVTCGNTFPTHNAVRPSGFPGLKQSPEIY